MSQVPYYIQSDANKKLTTVVLLEFGELPIKVPRDRNGNFEPLIVKKNQTSLSGLEEKIIAMYAKGMSTRDIQDHFSDLYGTDVSPMLISNVSNKILPLVKEWKNRLLESLYPIVFRDVIHFKVRNEGWIQSKATYVVLGITLDGFKEVLGIWIGESEFSKFWLMVLNELKNRGVNDILIACTDNLTRFSEAIQATFPQTEMQKCIVHQIRNSLRFVGYKELKAVTQDLTHLQSTYRRGRAGSLKWIWWKIGTKIPNYHQKLDG